jgi:hypothetical protein
MPEIATEPIETPADDDVKPSPLCIADESIKSGTPIL